VKYYDPLRPTVAGWPAYVLDGRPLCKLPGLWICPQEDGLWDLSLWALVGPTEGQVIHFAVQVDQVPAILEEYKADPEGALAKYWGYRPSWGTLRAVKPLQPDLSLDDLDL
jgi:hypothetical protein